MEETTKLLTVKETAQQLRISPANVYALAQKGQLPCCKIGKRRLFRMMDIISFINSNVEGGM